MEDSLWTYVFITEEGVRIIHDPFPPEEFLELQDINGKTRKTYQLVSVEDKTARYIYAPSSADFAEGDGTFESPWRSPDSTAGSQEAINLASNKEWLIRRTR
jgi:hypothetical protein